MACSKLFSGDLPEISSYIIQNLRNNVNTLYSLALVNRFWCRLAIPLLWENPFSVKCQENLSFHFIDTYFLFLSDTQFYSKFDSNLYNPLFNYPSLIKTINFYRIGLHVTNWHSMSSIQQSSSNYLQLINSQYEPIKRANFEEMKVFTALLRLFIENNASLNNLYMDNYHSPMNQFYDMMLNHPKFISEIEKFSFHYHPSVENLISAQTFLSSLTPLLSNSIKYICLSTSRKEFENDFAKIIQSQSHLSSVKFCFPKILNSLKHSLNTLTSIHFNSCSFSNNMRFDALSYLTQLESLQFKYCVGINLKVIQPLLSITTPLKIKSLVFYNNRFENSIEVSTPIQLLIQKIGSFIENLALSIYNDELRRNIFDVIINSCEQIKFLHLNHIDFMNISQLSRMILNFNNYLKYLTLEIKFHDYYNSDKEEDLKTSSMILNVLSKSLPLSLHYLDLRLIINPDDLQFVLENCKQVELKKLLIRNWCNNNIDTTLKVIKDFVKEKKLEFLAYYILNNHLLDNVCHKSLEKLVKEIQSFTKMARYDDLVIGISENDGSLMIS